MAKLFKMAFQGEDLQPVRETLVRRLQSDESDAGAWIDLSVVEQLVGKQSLGLHCQSEGLKLQRLYRSSWLASRKAVRVLAFMTEGEVNTNTPIDFLLEGFDVVLYSLYVAPGSPIPDDLPEHDVAIVAVSESDSTFSLLQQIETELMPNWSCPVLNRPSRIRLSSREEMYRLLKGAPGLYMPPTVRMNRQELLSLADGQGEFAFIARPIGSHAGNGLAKLAGPEAVRAYLVERDEPEFFVSPFIDYRSRDGLFRKYRIMWVDGRAYPVHMAIADEWKVWYLNADMAASAWKREEEETFLTGFESGFGRKHGAALASIAERFGLDYFGIDCGELPDGRLLVFEGSIALVAHDMDSPEIYPYKSPQMQRLFAAFYEMLKDRSKPLSRGHSCP